MAKALRKAKKHLARRIKQFEQASTVPSRHKFHKPGSMKMLTEVNKAMMLLKPVPKSRQKDFDKFEYFVQQDKEVRRKYENIIMGT